MSIFSIPFLLTNQVYDHTGNPGKQNNIQKIEKKAFPSEHDFHRAQIGDLRSRPGNHKCRRAAHTHSFPQPLLQQRNCSASAHIQRNADGCRQFRRQPSAGTSAALFPGTHRGSFRPFLIHSRNSAVAVNSTSPEELMAVSQES